MVWNLTREEGRTFGASTLYGDRYKGSRLDAAYGVSDGKTDEDKRLVEDLDGLSPQQARKKLRRLRRDLEQRIDPRLRDLSHLTNLSVAVEDIEAWSRGPLPLSRPKGSFLPELRTAIATDAVMDMNDWERKADIADYEQELFEDASCFILEHDWLSVLGRSDEFRGGSFRLPYDVTIFEFVIAARPIIALAVNYSEAVEQEQSENEVLLQLAVRALPGWVFDGTIYSHVTGQWQPTRSRRTSYLDRVASLLGDHIKAGCIALDAGVATQTPIRLDAVGRDLQEVQPRGNATYTIALSKSARAPVIGGGDSAKGAKRLHFRRGHWRHLPKFKTWIRWCLVGDPDLGFIEKRYRL